VLSVEGFDGADPLVRREALRCLANAMFLKPETRKVFVDVGGLDKFIKFVKGSIMKPAKRDADDDFLLGRIGFLLTAEKGDTVERLVTSYSVLSDLAKV
jgi:hypothetical protein